MKTSESMKRINGKKYDNDHIKLIQFFKREGIPVPSSLNDNPSDGSCDVNIKTLVWEVLITEGSNDDDDEMTKQQLEENENIEIRYVLTATPEHEMVDMKTLRCTFMHHHHHRNKKHSSNIIFRLASTEIAESKTGYHTGHIPPIMNEVDTDFVCLFVDEGMMRSFEVADICNVRVYMRDWIDVAMRLFGGERVRVVSDLSRVVESCGDDDDDDDDDDEGSNDGEEESDDDDDDDTLDARDRDVLKQFVTLTSSMNDAMYERCKLFRTMCKKKDRLSLIKRMINEVGDDFPSLMHIDPKGLNELDKSPLHTASWKGDLSTIQLLLLQTSASSALNSISTGSQNYGKTPIFYAITQCREDIVKYLLMNHSDSMNLLIVNNKGQTPCSLAMSHLTAETRNMMIRVENEQLSNGGVFVNYRKSHSDGRKYGDLDGRFEIDEANMDDDLKKEMDCLVEDDGEFDEMVYSRSFYDSKKIVPRSIRQTTRNFGNLGGKKQGGGDNSKRKNIGRREECPSLTEEEDDTLKSSNTTKKEESNISEIDSLELFTSRDVTPPIQNFDLTERVIDDLEGVQKLARRIGEAIANVDSAVSSCKHEVDDSMIIQHAWGLDCEWKPCSNKGRDNPVATLQLSSRDHSYLIDLQSLCQANASEHQLTAEEEILSRCLTDLFTHTHIAIVGFGLNQDIAKCMTSFSHLCCFRLFECVVDLQVLSHALHEQEDDDEEEEEEEGLSRRKRRKRKNKKKASLPRDHHSNSLQKLVAHHLDRRLDKKEQCSDWSQRPLNLSQIEYATLDAASVRVLLNKIMAKEARKKKSFFERHSHVLSTYRFTQLDDNDDDDKTTTCYNVPMGNVKTMLSVRYARQSWPTISTITATPPPPLPELQLEKKKEQEQQSVNDEDNNNNKKKKKSRKKSQRIIMLTTLSPPSSSDIPPPGSMLGYTKDSCIRAMIHDIPSSSKDYFLGYNRRGGVIDICDGWLLFVNFGSPTRNNNSRRRRRARKRRGEVNYKNDFLDGGRRVTFSIRADGRARKRSSFLGYVRRVLHSSFQEEAEAEEEDRSSAVSDVEETVIQEAAKEAVKDDVSKDDEDLSISSTNNNKHEEEGEKRVFLFARSSNKAKFIFCGQCRCVDVASIENGVVTIELEFIDFDALVSYNVETVETVKGEEEPCSEFSKLVRMQKDKGEDQV